jgi:hypothetical protein
MADRIARTSPTPDAIRYRLLRDALGPVHLSESLSINENGHDGGPPSAAETGYQLYAMAEMLLSVGHVGRQVRRACGRDGKWAIPLFREAREKIKAVIQRIRERSGPLPADLARYLDASLSENAKLLNVTGED